MASGVAMVAVTRLIEPDGRQVVEHPPRTPTRCHYSSSALPKSLKDVARVLKTLINSAEVSSFSNKGLASSINLMRSANC